MQHYVKPFRLFMEMVKKVILSVTQAIPTYYKLEIRIELCVHQKDASTKKETAKKDLYTKRKS